MNIPPLPFNSALPPDWNWLAILKDLAAGAPLNKRDYRKIASRAASWPTCACGQLCKDLPRTDSGVPVDHQLAVLGYYFAAAVKDRHWKLALATFHQIEARAIKLLDSDL